MKQKDKKLAQIRIVPKQVIKYYTDKVTIIYVRCHTTPARKRPCAYVCQTFCKILSPYALLHHEKALFVKYCHPWPMPNPLEDYRITVSSQKYLWIVLKTLKKILNFLIFIEIGGCFPTRSIFKLKYFPLQSFAYR